MSISVDISTDIVIDRPADAVARFTSNPDNAPRWYANITSVRWRSPRPLAVGSHLAFVARFMGKRLEYTYEVAEYEPGRKLVMRTAQGSFPMETTYEFESLGPAQCRFRLRNRGGPTGLAAIAAPLMSLAVRRENVKDLARLKELLER